MPSLMTGMVIVSGFGRCGSSMTMQMLAAGGIECLGEWPSFEHPKALKLDMAWLRAQEGKALKVLDPHRHRLPLALQEAGWWLRSDIIWAKPNPMPSSVTDRPGVAHEYVFLLTKSAHYFYDADAVREPSKSARPQHPTALSFGREVAEASRPGQAATHHRPQRKQAMKVEPLSGSHGSMGHDGHGHRYDSTYCNPDGRNMRTVWEIATKPFPEAHFATFPPALAERCIKAGCPRGGIVLDPFLGSGTTALVALTMGRGFLGIELNPDYAAMAMRRIQEKQESLRLLDFCQAADAPARQVG